MHRNKLERAELQAERLQVGVRVERDLLDAIDKHRASQPGLPSRAEVLRRAAMQMLMGQKG